MKISRIAKAAVLAATVTLAAPSVFAQNIAIVNGKAVPKARADAMIEQILKNQQPGQPPQARTPDLEQKVKDEIVMREIFIQEAERRGLNTSPDYKVQMEFARQSILIRALFQDFEAKNQMTEAEARAEYDKIKAANGAKELRARHILVENEAEAKDLLAKIKGGAKFEELAKQSIDPGSKENGGDLGWSSAGNFVKPFADALAALEKGKFTEIPVKSEFGYHVIQLEDSRPLATPPFDEVKPRLLQQAQSQQISKMVEDLRAKAKVQ